MILKLSLQKEMKKIQLWSVIEIFLKILHIQEREIMLKQHGQLKHVETVNNITLGKARFHMQLLQLDHSDGQEL